MKTKTIELKGTKYLIDKNNNRINLKMFNLIIAKKMLKSLNYCINCENCENCLMCNSCNNCELCFNLINCNNCAYSIDCFNCDGLFFKEKQFNKFINDDNVFPNELIMFKLKEKINFNMSIFKIQSNQYSLK